MRETIKHPRRRKARREKRERDERGKIELDLQEGGQMRAALFFFFLYHLLSLTAVFEPFPAWSSSLPSIVHVAVGGVFMVCGCEWCGYSYRSLKDGGKEARRQGKGMTNERIFVLISTLLLSTLPFRHPLHASEHNNQSKKKLPFFHHDTVAPRRGRG